MLNSIELTKQGEVLKPYPGTEGKDDIELKMCIGIHALCENWIDLCRVAPLHNALVCRGCSLRIIVPVIVSSWTRLETHFEQCKI